MENINAKQLSFILGEKTMSVGRARVMIFKANGINLQDPAEKLKHRLDKNPATSIEKFDKKHGLGIRKCVESIQVNFIHDKACIDWLFEDMAKKLKPNKETMAFSEYIRLPSVLRDILPQEMQEELKELCRSQFATQLKNNKTSII